MGIDERTEVILKQVVGKSNPERTRIFAGNARSIAKEFDHVSFIPYSLPLSNQMGYALFIEPLEDQDYILLGAHLDSAATIRNPLYHIPLIRDLPDSRPVKWITSKDISLKAALKKRTYARIERLVSRVHEYTRNLRESANLPERCWAGAVDSVTNLVKGTIDYDITTILENSLTFNMPGANDNGFGAAFNLAYAEEYAKGPRKMGLIVGGFPHEEGPGMYRFVALAGITAATASLLEMTVGNYVNPTLTYFMGYFAALQVVDLVGGPFKMGLAGSARPFRRVLEKHVELDKIAHAINMDMTGVGGEEVKLAIPRNAITSNPSRWIVPKKMDRKIISDMECMLLLAFNGRAVVDHHVMMGTSDNATLADYLDSVTGIFSTNRWETLHSTKDSLDIIRYKNATVYQNLVDFLVDNLGNPWKTESDIKKLEKMGAVSDRYDCMGVFEIKGSAYCLLRADGGLHTNPLNVLYELEGNRLGKFITYGVQENPLDLLRHPDSNLENGLGSFEFNEQGGETVGFKDSQGNSIYGYRRMWSHRVLPYANAAADFVVDRSIGLTAIGLAGIATYLSRGDGSGPSDTIIQVTKDVHQYSGQYCLAKGIVRWLPELTLVGTLSASITWLMLESVPTVRNLHRMLVQYAGNKTLPFQINSEYL